MDARDLSCHDLAMLTAAVGHCRRQFVSMIFGAIVADSGLDLQIGHVGRDYVLVVTEVVGEAVVAEHALPIQWDVLDETVRLCVLRVYVEGLLEGHRRWRRRMVPRLAAVGVALLHTQPAND